LKLHLWLALALGIYVVVISVSGSAVVFRAELSRALVPRFVPEATGERVQGDVLAAALASQYGDYEIVRFTEPRFPRAPVSVLVARDGVEHGRLFDPYAQKDMGESFPPSLRFVEWLVSLHDDLLAGEMGRKINGVGGALVLTMVVTGMIIWWPGKRGWKRSLYVPRGSARVIWHLHSALGLWVCLLLLNWALTSLYLAFPGPFEALRDWLDADPTDFDRPGDVLIPFLLEGHFGRFGGLWGRTSWTVLGLAPAALFLTGFWIWWRRRRLVRA
jgi:uncharacterized iron-regulated membrane protein